MTVDEVNPYFDALSRRSLTRSSATHTTTLQVDDGIRYINIEKESNGASGWVGALPSGTMDRSSMIQLCAYTKVQLRKREGERVYFKVLDGNIAPGAELHMNLAASQKYLRKLVRGNGIQIQVEYVNTKKVYSEKRGESLTQHLGILNYGAGKCQITLLSERSGSGYTRIPNGSYNILSPIDPHTEDYTAFYRNERSIKQFDQVWFPIEYKDNSRFIHIGNLSDGCVTVMDINDWEKVYAALIKNRMDKNGKYIGTITVS